MAEELKGAHINKTAKERAALRRAIAQAMKKASQGVNGAKKKTPKGRGKPRRTQSTHRTHKIPIKRVASSSILKERFPTEETSGFKQETTYMKTNAYMGKVFDVWYGSDAKSAILKPIHTSGGKLDYSSYKNNTNPKEFGAYTLDTAMQGLHLERTKVSVPDLSSFNGQEITEVLNHVAKKYGGKRHIAGIEYWEWICEEEERAKLAGGQSAVPAELKDGKWYFFPGSVLCDRDGHWSVPYVIWYDSKFEPNIDWLGLAWGSNYRVVLLER